MIEKKEHAIRVHVSTKDHKDPLVLLVKDNASAAIIWAKRTGHKESDAVVTQLGTLAKTITRPPLSDDTPTPKEPKVK